MKRRFKTLFLAAMCVTLAASSPAQTRVEVKKAGTLGQLLTQAQQDTCSALVLSGELNAEDLRVLRRMAGFQEEGHTTGQLALLDLHDCRMKDSGTPYMVIDAAEEWVTAGLRIIQGREKRFDTHTPKKLRELLWPAECFPCFYLNRSAESTLTAFEKSQACHIFQRPGYMLSATGADYPDFHVGKFDFTKDFTKKEKKRMKTLGFYKGHTHELRQENGRYMLYVYAREDGFPNAAFYRCPKLIVLVLPSDETTASEGFVSDPKSPILRMYLNKKKESD